MINENHNDMIERLLNDFSARMESYQSLHVDMDAYFSGVSAGTGAVWHLKQRIAFDFLRPNLARIERQIFEPSKTKGDKNNWLYIGNLSTFISDGIYSWSISSERDRYTRRIVDGNGSNIIGLNSIYPFSCFFDNKRSLISKVKRLREEGNLQALLYFEDSDHALKHVIEIEETSFMRESTYLSKSKFYFDEAFLLKKKTISNTHNSQEFHSVEVLNENPNSPLDRNIFKVELAPDAIEESDSTCSI